MKNINILVFEPHGRFPKALNTYLCTHLSPLIGRDAGVKALDLAGITHLGDLTARSQQQIAAIKGIGPERLKLITAWVRAQGFELNQPDEEWLKFARRCRVRARSRETRWINSVLRPSH